MLVPSQIARACSRSRARAAFGGCIVAVTTLLLGGCEPMVWQMEGPTLDTAVGRCLQGAMLDTTLEGKSRKECLVRAISERRATTSGKLAETLEASGFLCDQDRRFCRLSKTEKFNAMFGSSLRGNPYTIFKWIVDISISGQDTIASLQINLQQNNYRDGQVSTFGGSTDGSVPVIR